MAANSAIEWTDHTWSPWFGCTNVSPSCDNCYAEAWAKRSGIVGWGPHAERRIASPDYWVKPVKWNREAREAGVRKRVFPSLCDPFDNQAPSPWRDAMWLLIRDTPHLDWLLLTKRPQNIAKMLPPDWRDGYPNVWLGCTAENQTEADRRIPHLLAVPAAKRFLSCEPLLGPVDLRRHLVGHEDNGIALGRPAGTCIGWTPPLDLVICGGESGPNARPMHPDWARGLRDQCVAEGVAFFHKQNGEYASVSEVEGRGAHYTFPDGATVRRVGKKAAGALLDGREWREMPT